MAGFPNIFEVIQRLGFLRGYPSAYLVLLTAALILILHDWRWSLFALAGQYSAAGLLFVDVLDPRLAVIKALVGYFICLILYFTARQVNWGRLPEDVSPEEAVQLRQDRHVRLGPYLLPTGAPFRVFLALMAIVVVWLLDQQPAYHLPAVPEHFDLAVFALAGLGLVGMSLTSEPLKAGASLLTFLLGFELFYSALEQSVAMLALLAIADLAIALVIAYLTLARHAFPALLD